MYDRLVGRYSLKDIAHPETGEVIVYANEMMDEKIAKKITDAGIKEVEIRSVFGLEGTPVRFVIRERGEGK